MFNIGPLELIVLAVVGLVVLGPDKLPGFIRDARRLLVSLRDMATGARQQLRDELGPEFSDIDLRSLNPRTAITKAVFGDDPPPDLTKYDPRRFDARSSARRFVYGDDDAPDSSGSNGAGSSGVGSNGGGGSVSLSKNVSANGHSPSADGTPVDGASRPRPRPRPAQPPTAEPSRYDDVL